MVWYNVCGRMFGCLYFVRLVLVFELRILWLVVAVGVMQL